MRLAVSHIYPPIPCRDHDYCAFLDGEEEGGGYGYGPTAASAVADFLIYSDRCEDMSAAERLSLYREWRKTESAR